MVQDVKILQDGNASLFKADSHVLSENRNTMRTASRPADEI